LKPGAWDYVRKAFNAKPIGMFIPPNWIGLGIFGLLGLLNPGFWIIGAGVELGYLWVLGTNQRFQRYVEASQLFQSQQEWQSRIDQLVKRLGTKDQERYIALKERCQIILDQQHLQTPSPGLQAQGEGLGRLLWVYLRLLSTRHAIDSMVRGAPDPAEESGRLEDRIRKLQEQLGSPLTEDLRKSLAGQIEILQQRLEKRREAREKLAFLDAELTRIQEQVELVREQAVLSTDPESISERIDQITTTLGSTTQWISDQQKIYGSVEDLMTEPPALRLTVDE
jgi:hypothetical protein